MSNQRGAGVVEDFPDVPPGLEGPGYYGEDQWWPIRVAFTKWRVSAHIYEGKDEAIRVPSWDNFAGYVYNFSQKRHFGTRQPDYSPSFRDQCRNSKCIDEHFRFGGRNLHREEMNLHPAGEYLEMYDKLVGRMWFENSEGMVFLNTRDPLPLVHIIVNNSDGSHGRGHFDLFFPHKRHFGNTNTVCYMNNEQFSVQHKQVRENSAERAGVCPHCATTLDVEDEDEYRFTQGTVYHIKSGPFSSWPTDGVYGYRAVSYTHLRAHET